MSNKPISRILICYLLCAPLVIAQEPPIAKPHAGHPIHAATQDGQSSISGVAPFSRSQPTDPNRAPTFSGSRFEEGMRRAVNPCNTDYGQVFARLQDDVVQNTIQSWVWWVGIFSVFGLLVSLFYIYFLREREDILRECFARAAAILIGQRNTAYEKAREAILRHNALVVRHNELLSGTATAIVGQNLSIVGPKNQEENEVLSVREARAGVDTDGRQDEISEHEVEEVDDKPGVPMAFKVIRYKNDEYVSKKDRDRQVLSLDRKIDALRTENRRLKDRIAEYEGVN